MTIQLPSKNTEEGAETRVLLAECRTPAFSNYNLAHATTCMQLMDLVLWNRLANNPAQFGAPNANSLIDIIKAPGQFAGFRKYPNYDPVIVRRIQSMIDIANNPKDSRSQDFTDFINTAINIATGPCIDELSPGILAAWRIANSGSPGSNFKFYVTVLGNTFYYL